jgi:hypothetical protein
MQEFTQKSEKWGIRGVRTLYGHGGSRCRNKKEN